MRKKLRKLVLVLLFFFILGLSLTYALYHRSINEIFNNNSIILGSILEEHQELEKEIIENIEKENKGVGKEILKKYGFNSINSLEYLETIKNYQKTFFITYFMFYIILSIGILFYFYKVEKRRSQDIKNLDNYLFSLLEEEIKVDLKDFQSGELESLQNDLMKVTSRLKNALEDSCETKKELSKNLADISHQLKTPLTSLSIINDVLCNTKMNQEKRQEFLKKQEELILHLKELIISILKVSQIESGMIELKKDKINMSKLIKEVIDELELLIVLKNITVEEQVEKNSIIVGDELWLKEAISNILKNGVEHSKTNSKIIISLKETPLYVELQIKDFGIGIKKEDLPHVFERFYKCSQEKDSIGIGLNLSKSILDRMNATIRVTSKEKKGTVFIIHFYKTVV